MNTFINHSKNPLILLQEHPTSTVSFAVSIYKRKFTSILFLIISFVFQNVIKLFLKNNLG